MEPSVDLIIRPYEAADATAFRDLNAAWISTYFVMEPKDFETLDDPEAKILNPGGHILMAVRLGQPVGCVALLPMPDGRYELAKMAVSPNAQGQGIGRALIEAAIDLARKTASGLYLESNTSLKPAISLYESAGFVRLPDAGAPSPYARCNIRMQIDFSIKAGARS
jgi:putative acetyltransferase